MNTSPFGISRSTMGLCGMLAAMLMMGACAIQNSTSENDGDTAGVVVNVQDSSKITLDFSDDTKIVFTDSGSFNLDEIRKKMSDKGLNPDSVQITGIAVTYDSSSKSFVTANAGVKFSLKLYIREDGTGERKLALETMDKDIGEYKVLGFDPAMTLFELNKHIFGNPAGFPSLLGAVKDTTKHSAWMIGELTVKEKLKASGKLKLNMVVTVAGKI